MPPFKILFFTANPAFTPEVAAGREYREIEAAIRDSRYRDAMQLVQFPESRPKDLQPELERHEPPAVHFLVHGSKEGELLLQDDSGRKSPLAVDQFTTLLGNYRRHIKLVVLNACFSAAHAEALSKNIDFVVGMTDKIRNDSGWTFAAAFYRSLGYGRSVETAYQSGMAALAVEGLPGKDVVRLFIRPGVDATKVVLLGTQADAGSVEPPLPRARAVKEERIRKQLRHLIEEHEAAQRAFSHADQVDRVRYGRKILDLEEEMEKLEKELDELLKKQASC